jgi:uncharacterized lipoprotein YehR (DUF1307 family)
MKNKLVKRPEEAQIKCSHIAARNKPNTYKIIKKIQAIYLNLQSPNYPRDVDKIQSFTND